MLSGIRRYWFLVFLVLILFGGCTTPEWLEPLRQVPHLSDGLVAMVMFLTVVPHDFSDVKRTMMQPGPVGLAVFINAACIPILAWCATPILVRPFQQGLIIAAAVPCTLVSASVWTRRAGGNDLIPVIVTIITHLGCFAVLPIWMGLLLGGSSLSMSPLQMVVRLLMLVVAPMVIAQMVRLDQRLAAWTRKWRIPLSVAAQCGILMMIALGAAECGRQLRETSQVLVSMLEWGAMMTAVVAVHLAGYGLGWWVSGGLNFARPDRIGIAFAGSQKTLMVGLHAAFQLGGGLVMIPMIAYHILQLVADTFLADRLRGETEPILGLKGESRQNDPV